MTSIEWLIEQLRQLAHNPNAHLGMGDIRVTQGHLDELEEQAKQIENQQIIDAYDDGQTDGYNFGIESYERIKYKSPQDYYNETYGSKGSEFQQVDQNNPVTRGSTALVRVSKPTSSQTEISDEEIEMLAWENPCLSRQDVYELFDEVFKNKTVQGIFKISVSKEVRQFKERLRQLAKEKYREQLKNK